MRTNVLTLLVGFVVMCGLVLLFKVGLDKMTAAEAAPADAYAQLNVDMNRRAILYRVKTGDTLWSLADRFYGSGHRWTEISRANEMAAGQGLQTGAVIKIPLAPGEATPLVNDSSAEPAPAAGDAVEATVAGPDSGDESAVDRMTVRAAPDKFPSGLVCVARTTERQTVTLNIYDPAAKDNTAIATYESRKGMALCEMRADDFDGDGVQEIHTIWRSEEESPLSRVLRVEGNRIEVVCETPNDPVALARLRARDSR